MAGRNYFGALLNLAPEDGPGSPVSNGNGGKNSSVSNGGGKCSSKGEAGKDMRRTFSNALQDKQAEAEVSEAPATEEKRKELRYPMVWLDLEMTGLDLENDTIIEIACIVTNGNLDQVFEGPEIAIHHPAEVMNAMNDWCKEHHGTSGLTERCLSSTVSMQEAEDQVLAFVQRHTQPGTQLAGNSVHVDLAFLRRYMPRLAQHLHYRIVDVSSLKELARRWYPMELKRAPKKVMAHTALSDIRESIEELKYYRKAIFKTPAPYWNM